MVPKYSFDLFIQRCQVLGTHKRLTVYNYLCRLICPRSEKSTKARTHGSRQATKRLKTCNLTHRKRDNNCIMAECFNRITKPWKWWATMPFSLLQVDPKCNKWMKRMINSSCSWCIRCRRSTTSQRTVKRGNQTSHMSLKASKYSFKTKKRTDRLYFYLNHYDCMKAAISSW